MTASTITSATAIPRGRHRELQSGYAVRYAFAMWLVLAAVLPFLWVARVAFRPVDAFTRNPAGLGGGFTLVNFRDVWSSGMLGNGFVNTLSIVPAAALLATFMGSLAGFALAKLDLPGKRLILGMIAVAMCIPMPAIVIPLFNQGLQFHYADSRLGLVLVYGGLFSAWSSIFMYAYFQSMPSALIEAARIDGANSVLIFLRIAVPLAAPAIATVYILNLFSQWGELLLALVLLPQTSLQTLTVHVAALTGQFPAGGPATAAGALITAIPILIVFAVCQRFFRTGVTAGAVKL
jgi:ABC-type glycerol-3-phosphate transport system permease component